MAQIKARAFTVEAVPLRDGLHLVLPSAITRLALRQAHREAPPTGRAVPMYAVEINGVIQLSYEKLELSIPAIALRTEEFVPASQPE